MNEPFRLAWIFFAVAWGVLWLPRRERLASGLVWCGLAAMGCGFAWRAAVSGRAPVTNMYESILWVALGVVAFAAALNARCRLRGLYLCALPVAVAALVAADSRFDAAITPLPPVLRHNWWLGAHVLTVTSGYAAFALAMGLAHLVLLKRIRGRDFSGALARCVHRLLRAGVLLLALGTVLGAFWANIAWGRFWGWDPKETWALISLVCYIALLHGRQAGWWRGYGLAVGSILAFQAVLMAWYGVNFVLGQGLHSYGRGTGGGGWVAGYVLAEAGFLVFAIRKPMPPSR